MTKGLISYLPCFRSFISFSTSSESAPHHTTPRLMVLLKGHGTLKSMLRKFVDSGRKDWDEYLPNLLFAYREVPQESTSFSPFKLLYVLREAWTGETASQSPMVTQVMEIRERLMEMMGLVTINMEKAQGHQKWIYDQETCSRTLEVGEQVLVLLPNPHNSLKSE